MALMSPTGLFCSNARPGRTRGAGAGQSAGHRTHLGRFACTRLPGWQDPVGTVSGAGRSAAG
jgi:hypothetical protein